MRRPPKTILSLALMVVSVAGASAQSQASPEYLAAYQAGQIAASDAAQYIDDFAIGVGVGVTLALIDRAGMESGGQTKSELYAQGFIGAGLMLGIGLLMAPMGSRTNPPDRLTEGMAGDDLAGFTDGYRRERRGHRQLEGVILGAAYLSGYLATVALAVDDDAVRVPLFSIVLPVGW